jgi:hypothetical protein
VTRETAERDTNVTPEQFDLADNLVAAGLLDALSTGAS